MTQPWVHDVLAPTGSGGGHEGRGLDALPYGAFRTASSDVRVGVRVGDHVLDLTAAAGYLLPQRASVLAGPTLDPLLRAGAQVWAEVRAAVQEGLSETRHRAAVEHHLVAETTIRSLLPFTVADYVDFYSSEQHALNVGRIFRPDSPGLPAAWRELPIGYHGRAGTVVVSGTDVRRPNGIRRVASGAVEFGPCQQLDLEAEVGFVVGVGSQLGESTAGTEFPAHVFGAVLLNDWSARDIQSFEYVPLGPFLGKSFATSVSAWVLPMAALEDARVTPPDRDPVPLGPARRLELAAVGPRPHPRGRGQRHRRLQAALRLDVLDARPAAGAPHRERRRPCGPVTSSVPGPSAVSRSGAACSSCSWGGSARFR